MSVYIVTDASNRKVVGVYASERLANNMAELYTITNGVDTIVTCHRVRGGVEA